MSDVSNQLARTLGEFKAYFLSSIGKKQTLGAVGAVLVMFLAGHMLGNLQLLNPDLVAQQASYNDYCKFLTGMKPMIWFVEAALVAILLIHVMLACVLKFGNRASRGAKRYAVVRHAGEVTCAAYTMFASGVVVFVFLLQHLRLFKFGNCYLYQSVSGEIIRDMWLTTVQTFASPGWTVAYVVAVLVVGAHLIHAIPSLFRTFGLVHARWTVLFNLFGVLAAAAIMGGFAVTAIGSCVLVNRPEGKALIQKSLEAQAQLAARQMEGVRK